MSNQLACRSDWAAYVLGGLDPEQALACRAHLRECAECRDEVELLEGAAVALPMMSAQSLPAVVAPARTARDVRRDLRAQLRVRSPTPSVSSRGKRTGFLLRPVPKPALAGLGALLVAAAITVALSFQTASTRIIRAQVSWTPGGAVVELTGHRGQLLVDSMPAPPSGDTYEVWVRHGHGRLEPVTTFDVNSAGQAELGVPGSLSAGDAVVVAPRPLTGAHPVREHAMLIAQL